MRTDDFDFPLPQELIAQRPVAERSTARMLHVRADGALSDRHVADLPLLLRAGDLLVVNDTRVIKARLLGSKDVTGGRVEALVERVTAEHEALVQLRASKAPAAGAVLSFVAEAATPAGMRPAAPEATARARVLGRDGEFYRLAFDQPVLAVLDAVGSTPLPPYIAHRADAEDERRYQTVWAREPGAVAAPTAGLHFDQPLLAALERAGVERATITLHVGAGTFQPVRVDDVAGHRMHAERFAIPEAAALAIARARARGGRVVAVGTTSLRALESRARPDGSVEPGSGETSLFITPGYAFKAVDCLVTNFHLPRSTLFMLVCAFAGIEVMRAAYAHAIAHRYRFFSYGDAMLIERRRAGDGPPTRVGVRA